MTTIHITIIDVPGVGVSVRTDAPHPANVSGLLLTGAESLATDLLTQCLELANDTRFGPNTVPLVALANDLLHPEALGHAVTGEVRDRARMALGRAPAESSHLEREVEARHQLQQLPGVDIDAVHTTRATPA